MYTLIGIAMVLTAGMLAAFAASLVLTALWPALKAVGKRLAPRNEARFWFCVALVPASAGLWFALLVAAPSYRLHEPRNTGETISLALGMSALLAGFLLTASIVRAVLLTWRGWRMASLLRKCSKPVRVPNFDQELYQLPESSSTFTVVGILHPAMFVSRSVLDALTETELQSVLRHEQAHLYGQHNGLTLVVQFGGQLSGNPVFQRLVHARWTEAIELSADEAALRTPEDALELGSALVKVARLRPGDSLIEELGTSFVPSLCRSALGRRVDRLRLAASGSVPHVSEFSLGGTKLLAALSICAVAITLLSRNAAVMQRTHAFLELFMK